MLPAVYREPFLLPASGESWVVGGGDATLSQSPHFIDPLHSIYPSWREGHFLFLM